MFLLSSGCKGFVKTRFRLPFVLSRITFYKFLELPLHFQVIQTDILRYVMPATEFATTDRRSAEENPVRRQGIASFFDPLRAGLQLPFHHVLFPYGFSTHIKTNDPALIRAAELSWGAFRSRFREEPIELRFLVSDFTGRRRPPNPVFRAQANLLTMVADAHNFACCDLASGFGFACLTKAAVVSTDYVRYHFLDAMVSALLDTQHMVAIHAACVAKDSHGVLLVGDSGAGKSSLAYACARRGWTYIADDSSSVLRRKIGRLVVGNPQTFRFRPAASELFPELDGRVRLRNGKPTMEIRTERLPHLKTAVECSIDYVIFLDRLQTGDSAPNLAPVSREESLRRLFQKHLWPAELPIHDERLEAVERLLDAHLLQLTYNDLEPAIDLLERVMGEPKP